MPVLEESWTILEPIRKILKEKARIKGDFTLDGM